MKKFHTMMSILVFVLLLLASGCLQYTQLLKVNPDGSGMIDVTMMMSTEMTEMLNGMATIFSPDSTVKEQPAFDLFSEDEMRKQAKTLGKDVSFISGEKKYADGYEGYSALYSFTTITDVSVGDNVEPPSPGIDKDSTLSTKKENFLFRFEKGNPNTLTIVSVPDTGITKGPDGRDSVSESIEPNDEMIASLKTMLKGMRVDIALEVQGTIISTNATHRDGNRVTLMDLSFENLLGAEKQLKNLARHKPETQEELKEMLRNIPGVKFEFNDETTIKFR